MPGRFITFEGGEGSGKSTQVKLLAKAIEQAGLSCLTTREPGGTASAERIRELLVTGDADTWHPHSETLLFYAARLEHMEKLVKPALAEEKIILCDRFTDSTRVYQGVGKQVADAFINPLHQLTMQDFSPDLTIILDIAPEAGLKRAAGRGDDENRFESMALEFHQKVRQGFMDIAASEPKRCAVIDAEQPPETVHTAIKQLLAQRLQMELT